VWGVADNIQLCGDGGGLCLTPVKTLVADPKRRSDYGPLAVSGLRDWQHAISDARKAVRRVRCNRILIILGLWIFAEDIQRHPWYLPGQVTYYEGSSELCILEL
jgi:hypothetical protein